MVCGIRGVLIDDAQKTYSRKMSFGGEKNQARPYEAILIKIRIANTRTLVLARVNNYHPYLKFINTNNHPSLSVNASNPTKI